MSRNITPSVLRRTVARLRAGTIVPSDPYDSPAEVADALEREIARREANRKAIPAGNPLSSQEELREMKVQERRRRAFDLHRLRKLPEASDPDSPVAESVRHLHRRQRQQQGRTRKRKGGK